MKAIVPIMALALLACQAWSAGLAKSGIIERTTTIKNVGAMSMESSKLYWKGDNMRAEQYTTMGVLIRIKKGSVLYTYSPLAKKASKMVVPAGKALTVQQMLQEITGPVKGGKKVGTARVVGVNCDIYSASGKGGSVKAYVSKDARLPAVLRSQEVMGSASRMIETRQLKLNCAVSDSMFSLPKGVTVTEEKYQEPSSGSRKQ